MPLITFLSLKKISPNKTKSTNCITINYIKQMPQAAANLTNPFQTWAKIRLIRKIKIQLVEF